MTTFFTSDHDTTPTGHFFGFGISRQHSQMENPAMAFAINDGQSQSPSKFKRTESIEYKAIFAVTFTVFLVAEIAGLLLPHRWLNQLSGQTQQKSLVQRAKASASTCAAYAFMG